MPPNSDSTMRYVGLRGAVEHEQPAARPLAAEEPRQRRVGVIAARQALRIWIVVVDADDVGGDALPAVVADHRPRRIERVRQVVQRLRRSDAPPGCPAGSGTPHDSLNGTHATMHGMAAVALDRRRPLARRRARPSLGEAIGAGHLLPDQQAEPIGPVQIARVLELLMLAHAVEAHRLGQLDIAPQRRVVWRGQSRYPANSPDRAPAAAGTAGR